MQHKTEMIRIGIDVGSTTVKMVAVDNAGEIVFSKYERHNAKAKEVLGNMLAELQSKTGDVESYVRITGSVGMGISEHTGIPFMQEVVAATKAIQKLHPDTRSMIDIGGEDAKIVFFKNGRATDLRMNGNCAGGTGAFIDQMAVILGTTTTELDKLALKSTQIYPIASRCGVFCKTDIQNLIAKNAAKEDIAASIFHAVAVQTVVTLAHGCKIETPVLFCGGPLTFMSALRKAFADYMNLKEEDIILPENGTLLPAIGTAIAETGDEKTYKLSQLAALLNKKNERSAGAMASGLKPIFSSADEYDEWKRRISENNLPTATFVKGNQDVYIGIDSGSTTTKIVVTDTESRLLYTYYHVNGGNPIEAVEKGLQGLKEECQKHGTVLNIKGSCSTGYGEDLIKSAFQLNSGIVETIAHYEGARFLNKDVSFILDIGGQDMKAIFVDNGIINHIEINEACSSGCGSFIETFANTLGYSAQDFSREACRSELPCDLGTRCTVFMNSKVKQVLREGATVEDIAAGLAYSVIKNCLYKVLKLKDTSALGKTIVVQGGTMRNDAIVRSLEIMTGAKVLRCNVPELMGAFGCALYAKRHFNGSASLESIITKSHYVSKLLHCKGCDNQCPVTRYSFDNGKKYYSGNRCERVFTNGDSTRHGNNVYKRKEELLFGRASQTVEKSLLTLGIPRCLNMYEEFPFWHTLFTACGINVMLSGKSDYAHYERSAHMVMADNICFPAKLVHSHVQELIERKADRIFMPYVIFEKQDNGQNSYNCPVVTGYSDVIKSVQSTGIPVDSPAISFKDTKLLYKQCHEYLDGLGIRKPVIEKAFEKALNEQEKYEKELAEYNREVLKEAENNDNMVILLAGRPYHTDTLIQHQISEMIANMGVDVITDDIVRGEDIDVTDVNMLRQWAYPNRILKAAKWCILQKKDIQFIEMTSFGCGPDAFLVDEVRDLLMKNGKAFTLLKLDDISNIGSVKLRVRSLIESIRISRKEKEDLQEEHQSAKGSTGFLSKDKKILIPYFTPFISPLIPSIMKLAGYDVETLPLSDTESCEWGLKYANNEVCYPATLIVGDIIKAFKSGKYNPENCIVAMSQTGGQCRASNYIALIKKALDDAGFSGIPVVSLTYGDKVQDDIPGFDVDWKKMLPVALRAVLYSDCISKFYYASVVREKEPGQAKKLKDYYLYVAAKHISNSNSKALPECLAEAADEFNSICIDKECPRVGIVGEIFLKFNPFAQKNVTDWLISQGIEVVPSVLTDFFMQNFVNESVRTKSYIKKKTFPTMFYKLGYKIVWKQIEKFNRIGSGFRYFEPIKSIFEEAEGASNVISLNAQFGEGWLLPAEIISYAKEGITNVVSLQPFGCIANHIVSKGIENRIKNLYPDINILSLDFDSGVSDVNITNRLLLFIDNLKKTEPCMKL